MRRLLCLTWVAAVVIGFGADASAAGGLLSVPVDATHAVESRVAVARANGRTARWYSLILDGNAGGVVWFLPIRPQASADFVSAAWFEAIDHATAVRVLPPNSVPPCKMDTKTETIASWTDPPTEMPIDSARAFSMAKLDEDVNEWGFVIPHALRVQFERLFEANIGVGAFLYAPRSGRTATRPIRIVDDAPVAVPLLLTRGVSVPVSVTAFVIGPDKAAFGGRSAIEFPENDLQWMIEGHSNYRDLRDRVLRESPNAWLVEGASHTALFGETPNAGERIPSITETYFKRAMSYIPGAPSAATCVDRALRESASSRRVARACPRGEIWATDVVDGGSTSACTETPAEGELAADTFRCAGADDLAIALSGNIPEQVSITRAAGMVSEGVYGQDVSIGWSNGELLGPARIAKTFAGCRETDAGTPPPVNSPPASPGSSGQPPPPETPYSGGYGSGYSGGGCSGSATVEPEPESSESSGSETSSESSDSDSCSGDSSNSSEDDDASDGVDDEDCDSDTSSTAGDDDGYDDSNDDCDGDSSSSDGSSSRDSASGDSCASDSSSSEDRSDSSSSDGCSGSSDSNSSDAKESCSVAKKKPSGKSPVSRAVLGIALLLFVGRRMSARFKLRTATPSRKS